MQTLKKKSERFLYFGDVHIPHQDKDSLAWVLDTVREWRPKHLVFGGDGIDANAASRWPNEYRHTLEDEYSWFGDMLADFRKAAPKGAQLVRIEGNHEDNIGAKNRIPEDLRGLCSLKKHVPEAANWKDISYTRHHKRGAYRVGQVAFIHGHETAAGKLAEQAIKMANYEPFSLTISGHTHRPTHTIQQVMLRKTPLAHWWADAGCHVDWEAMDYMKRLNMTDWGHALVLGEAVPTKSPRKSREWNAEVRIRAMAGDTDVCLWKSGL